MDHAAIDFQMDFVQMPSRMGLESAFAQVRRDLGSKMVHPSSHRFIGNRDSAFRQQIFNVTEAQGEPDIKQIACWMISGGKR